MRHTLALALALALAFCPSALAQAPPAGFPDLVSGLKAIPGVLGVETARTSTGKQVIFAWFANKAAALDWYDSEMHRAAQDKFFPDRHQHEPMAHVPENVPILAIASITFAEQRQMAETTLPISQIAIELYTPLPGGAVLGGRFAPSTLQVAHMMDLAGTKATAPPPADSGAFVIRLGTDTLALERWVRHADRIEAQGISRSPSTVVRGLTIWLDAAGRVARIETTTRPGSAPPDAAPTRNLITFSGDSATIETTTAAGATRTRKVAARADMVPLLNSFFFPYELAVARARAARGQSASVAMLMGGGAATYTVRRAGANAYTIDTGALGVFRARTDAQGRVLSLDAGALGQQIERVATLDIPALAQQYAARDAAGTGLGPLSPRDTVHAMIAGAHIYVDYSRPAKRGRTVFGGLVPWNQAWRTGANLATHFWTDRPLTIGGRQLPAGLYTLFTLPAQSGWKLIINKETGQAGTAYRQELDFARLDMTTTSLTESVERLTIAVEPQGPGGVLKLSWDRTEAVIPFRVGATSRAAQLVEEAARALGGKERVNAVKQLLMIGTGESYSLGQNTTPEAPLPRQRIAEALRVVDFAARRWRLEITRVAATGAVQRQVLGYDDGVSYTIAANGNVNRGSALADRDARLAPYRHPIGALQAALAMGATLTERPRAGGDDVVDVRTADGDEFTLHVDASSHLPRKVVVMTYNVNLGDVASETEFADYTQLGSVRLPGRVIDRVGGLTTAELSITSAVNPTVALDLAAPGNVRSMPATAPTANVTVEEAAPGVWYLAGQSHHSVLVEFRDHLALIEAPQNDTRTLAVIQKARELRPNKPLRYLINSHHHFDHSGGIRAATSEGLTIVTHEKNRAFYEEVARRKHTIVQDALAKKPQPLRIETVADKKVLTDGARALEIYPINGSAHAETLLMVYFPAEKLLVEADVYSPPAPNVQQMPAMPFAANLLENIRNRNLAVERIVPIHGRIVSFEELVRVVEGMKAAQ